MWSRIKQNFDNGLKRVQWFASLLSDRVRIEMSLFRMYGKIENLEGKKREIMKSIGEEVFQMSSQAVGDVYSKKEVRDAIKEIEELDNEIEEIRKEASEVSSLS